MKPRTTGKIIAAVMLGLLLAGVMHHDTVKRSQAGREQFVEKQAARFDKYFAQSAPFVVDATLWTIATGVMLGAYELLAFTFSSALKKSGTGDA